MPMLDASEWGLEEAVEPVVIPDGDEAKIRILGVNEGTDKNGAKYLLPRFDVPSEPYSKEFTLFLHQPDSKQMEAKRLNAVRNRMTLFLECFEIDVSRPFDPADLWPGHEGWVIVGVEEDDQYGERNFVKKLLKAK